MASTVSECDLETVLEYDRNRSAVIRLILMAENVLFLLLSTFITVNFDSVYRPFRGVYIEFATLENPFSFRCFFNLLIFNILIRTAFVLQKLVTVNYLNVSKGFQAN